MQLIIKNGLILQSNGTFLKGHVGVDNGKIAALWYGEEPPPDRLSDKNVQLVDAARFLVSPGLIDTHVHGGMGYDFTYEKDGWEKMEERLRANGVTSILATISSRPPDKTLECIDRVKAIAEKNSINKVSIAGIHMEGPYLHKARKGIHVEEYIRPACTDEIKQILERAGGLVRVWTLAPDIKENMDAIAAMTAAGVSVSIAHTEADYETALAAFSAGANRVTHTFNTIPAISHRYTGIVTAAWQHSAFMELIADGQHVSPTIAKMLIAATDPGKLVLVSDNNEFSGLPDASYIQDNRKIIIANGQMKTEFGVLAGSIICINNCALNVLRWGFSAGAALKMASENPARAAGIFDTKGSIALGKDADIAILDGQFEAMMTIKDGKIVYRHDSF